MKSDFNWVMKVIESCESPWQILAADKLIDAFAVKYKAELKADSGCMDELCTHLQVKHASLVSTTAIFDEE